MVEVIKTLEDLQAQVSQAADLQEFWKEAIEGNKIPASVLTQAIACKLEGLDKYLHLAVVKREVPGATDEDGEEEEDADDDDDDEDGADDDDDDERSEKVAKSRKSKKAGKEKKNFR